MYTKQAILLFASLLGSISAIYTFLMTLEMHSTGLTEQSFCSVNSLFDCNSVAASQAALLFGIPVAWWAFMYYLWLGSVAMWTLYSLNTHKPLFKAALLLSVIACIFSLYKAYQMVFQLGIICLICFVMYFINLIILLLMIRIVGLEIKRTWQEYGILTQYIRKHSLQYLITTYLSPFFSISVVFLIGYIVVIRSIHAQTNNQAQAILADNSLLLSKADYFDELTRHFAQSKRDVRLIEDVPILGTPDARVTVLAFSDFQCPYCQLAALQVKKILSEYRDNIKLYFIHYPLDPSINSNISSKGHLYAGLAARASMYAYDRGKFWEFHDDLFELQPTLSKETVFSLTNKYGWNRDQFEIAIESPIIINRVKKHIQWGQEIGIKVTPSLFINGRQVINWQDSLLLRQIINKELQISNFQ